MREGGVCGGQAALVEEDEFSMRLSKYLALNDAIFTI